MTTTCRSDWGHLSAAEAWWEFLEKCAKHNHAKHFNYGGPMKLLAKLIAQWLALFALLVLIPAAITGCNSESSRVFRNTHIHEAPDSIPCEPCVCAPETVYVWLRPGTVPDVSVYVDSHFKNANLLLNGQPIGSVGQWVALRHKDALYVTPKKH